MDRFDYGNRDLSGNPGKHDGLTQAWLSSSLAISPQEQARFLGKLVSGELPVSAQTLQRTANILRQPDIDGWRDPSARPAWATPSCWMAASTGISRIGWFVGWASKQDRSSSSSTPSCRSLASSLPPSGPGKRCLPHLPEQLKKL